MIGPIRRVHTWRLRPPRGGAKQPSYVDERQQRPSREPPKVLDQVVPPMAKKSVSPVEDDDTGELTPEQIEKLKAELIGMREEVLKRMNSHVTDALEEQTRQPDEVDQATSDQAQAFLLRLGDKERKLYNLIQLALHKMEEGTFGICEGTGEPIPFKRLSLRPWARYSVEYKAWLEKERKLHVED